MRKLKMTQLFQNGQNMITLPHKKLKLKKNWHKLPKQFNTGKNYTKMLKILKKTKINFKD